MNQTPIGYQSWVPPEITWLAANELLMVQIPSSDPDLVEFLAKGKLSIRFSSHKKTNALYEFLIDDRPLAFKLSRGLCNRPTGHISEDREDEFIEDDVYLYGAFALPHEAMIIVVASTQEPEAETLPRCCRSLQEEAMKLFREHEKAREEYKNEVAEQCKRDEELRKKLPNQPFWPTQTRFPPEVTAESLLPLSPRAVYFPLGRITSPDRMSREALKRVADSSWSPPRAGEYSALIGRDESQNEICLINWEPYDGLPAQPEVRWAVQIGLRRALQKPRQDGFNAPSFEGHDQRRFVISLEDIIAAGEVFADTRIDDSAFSDRVASMKSELEQTGFDAIAWYQPFHSWDDKSWGIFFDAKKLDDLPLLLLEESKAQRARALDYGVCCRLAIGLVFAHELFHARVETCLSWMELQVSGPRYLRYKEGVYNQLKGTDDWLEEALANWVSWDWCQSFFQDNLSLDVEQSKAANNVVEGVLDLSPPGYNNWRVGENRDSWRLLTSQMAKGKPSLSAKSRFPLEGILLDQAPYDLRTTDIPIFFVGEGEILDRIESLPYVINTPDRKEIIKALKYFSYERQKSGGKGSHEKWVGPNKYVFTLPKRDPLSKRVFKSFLEHFSLDKNEYAQDIRPKL